MAEVASVMTFFEWVCSGGFQIVVRSWSWFAPVVFGFQIGSGDDFFLSAWRLESLGKEIIKKDKIIIF